MNRLYLYICNYLGILRRKVSLVDLYWVLIFSLFLSIPAAYSKEHFAKIVFLLCFLHSFSWSMLFVFFLQKHYLKMIIYVFIMFLFIIEMFCIFGLGTRFSAKTLLLVLQTNVDEITTFFSNYIFSHLNIIPCIILLVLNVLVLVLAYKLSQITFKLPKIAYYLFVPLLLLGIMLPYCNIPINNWDNSVLNLVKSSKFIFQSGDEISNYKKYLDRIHIISSPDKIKAPTITLILGESFNKYFSSLYGYSIDTNPQLAKYKESDNLILYENILTPTSITNDAMKYVFTHKECPPIDVQDSCQYILMPAVFKQAAYEVNYLDNQYQIGGGLDFAGDYFMAPEDISEKCFDFRSDRIYKYDGDFIDAYSSRILRSSKCFNIIHLYGQHSMPRFPQEFDIFKGSDILSDSIGEKEKEQIADYLNAVRYNDYVVNKILELLTDNNAVVIYISDHGECVYNGNGVTYGRIQDNCTDLNRRRNVHEIPLMIWCSDKYKENNMEVFERIKASRFRVSCLADIPFLLYELACIDFNYNKPSKSIINPYFVPHEIYLNESVIIPVNP